MTRPYTKRTSPFPTWREPSTLVAPPMAPLIREKTPLHDSLGVSPEYTRAEYMKIVNQDEHLPTKLKALAPLARELGLDTTEGASPTTNIIIVPQEIVKKYALKTQVIHDVPATPTEA